MINIESHYSRFVNSEPPTGNIDTGEVSPHITEQLGQHGQRLA